MSSIVIIVNSKGFGKYIVKAEGQKSLTVHEMNSEIVTNCSLNSDVISAQVADHYYNKVLNWNREKNYRLVQGSLPNNQFVFVQQKIIKDKDCYSD